MSVETTDAQRGVRAVCVGALQRFADATLIRRESAWCVINRDGALDDLPLIPVRFSSGRHQLLIISPSRSSSRDEAPSGAVAV